MSWSQNLEGMWANMLSVEIPPPPYEALLSVSICLCEDEETGDAFLLSFECVQRYIILMEKETNKTEKKDNKYLNEKIS